MNSNSSAGLAQILQAFREKIRKAHPDAGGTAKEFKEALREMPRIDMDRCG